MAVVELNGVNRVYGDFTALVSLNFRVEDGEFLTLLGPSGSGKTTLLNIIAGLTPPSSGRVEIDGHDVTNVHTRHRGLGMVFQNYALMPHMTVFDNIAFPLRTRKTRESEIRERVSEVIQVVNLQDFAGRKPHELSGGQQQRVAIARCLVYKPQLILMDEPLGALDKKLREQLQLEIKRLHSEFGVTIIYVTHDQEEALAMSDRIVLMNRGRIEQYGTPDELYFRPKTVFTAQFLGESNVLEATVTESDSEKVVLLGPVGAIKALPREIAVGDKAAVLVRPENVRMLRPGEQVCNEVSGNLIQTIFIGGSIRHYVKTDEGTVIILKELTRAMPQIASGEKVTIGWAAEHTMVI